MRLNPGDDLAAVLGGLAEGTEVELGAGEFRLAAGFTLTRKLWIRGQGPERTRVLARRAPHGHVLALDLTGPPFELDGLTLGYYDDDGEAPGVYLFQSDVLVVRRGFVWLRDCRLAGSAVEHAKTGKVYGGAGLRVGGGADVVATACTFEAHGGQGVAVVGPAHLALDTCRIAGNRGFGLAATGDADVRVQATIVADNGHGGLVLEAGAGGTMSDSVIENNRGPGLLLDTAAACQVLACSLGGNAGPGVEVRQGRPTLSGNAIVRSRLAGCLVAAGAGVEATENRIEDTDGDGIQVGQGATVHLVRNAVYRSRAAGVSIGAGVRGLVQETLSSGNGGPALVVAAAPALELVANHADVLWV
jgi:hypothetical protein